MQNCKQNILFCGVFSLDVIFHVGTCIIRIKYTECLGTFRFGQLPLDESCVLYEYWNDRSLIRAVVPLLKTISKHF